MFFVWCYPVHPSDRSLSVRTSVAGAWKTPLKTSLFRRNHISLATVAIRCLSSSPRPWPVLIKISIKSPSPHKLFCNLPLLSAQTSWAEGQVHRMWLGIFGKLMQNIGHKGSGTIFRLNNFSLAGKMSLQAFQRKNLMTREP